MEKFWTQIFERLFISQFKNARLRCAEVNRMLWKIKNFVYFCWSVQPISLRTLVTTIDRVRLSK